MKILQVVEPQESPLLQEKELLTRLQKAEVYHIEEFRIAIAGRRVFLDGFVASVREKRQVENTCRKLAPDVDLINRLRVASCACGCKSRSPT
jgi:hypothetical protein